MNCNLIIFATVVYTTSDRGIDRFIDVSAHLSVKTNINYTVYEFPIPLHFFVSDTTQINGRIIDLIADVYDVSADNVNVELFRI